MYATTLFAPFLLLFSGGGLIHYDEGTLSAADAAPWDRAGEALALDGDLALVGARWQDTTGPDSGAAYVHTRANYSWSQTAKLVGSDSLPADEFGTSTALEGDTAVVGAPTADLSGSNEGAVYVFVFGAGVWTEQAKLTASDSADEDRFGSAVAIEGDLILVGAKGDDDDGSYSGSAYVFTRTGSAWSERAKLLPGDGTENRYFGSATAISGDTLLVGAPGIGGGAYVFVGAGTVWNLQAKLTDASGSSLDRFATALDIEGDTAVVGSPFDDDNGSDSGSAIVFDRVGATWTQNVTLLAGEGLGELGTSVSIHGDRVAAGAPADYQFGSEPLGAAYVFLNESGTWGQAAAIFPAGLTPYARFGASIDCNGPSLVVGAPGSDDAAVNGGAAQGYTLAPGIDAFCFGDSTGSGCPCGNTGSEGAGCANSTGQGGALAVTGSPSTGSDELIFSTADLPPGVPALFFAGTTRVNGGLGAVFGDGLRCVGGTIRRGGVSIATGGSAQWGPGLASALSWSPGDLRRAQAWYRDPTSGPCGSGFNLTNAIELTLIP